MNVLMIEHFSSSNMYTVDLCNKLSDKVNLKLLTVNDSQLCEEMKFKYEKCLFGSVKGSKIFKSFIYLKSLVKIVRELVVCKYDVVHIQSFRNYKVELIIFFIIKPIINKIVYTAHNILPHDEKNKLDKQIYKAIYKISDKIVVHNEFCKNQLIRYFLIPESKIVIIPHGAYDNLVKDVACGTNSKVKDKTNVLVLGMIRKYKGIDILIEAISKLNIEDRDKFRVIIAGKQNSNLDGTDYKKMIEENKLQEIITFIPERISDDKMAEYYGNADVCVFPYKEIYGSGALLMSYTFNKPVIVSNNEVFKEETNNGQTGLMFENGSSSDLAKKLIEFHELDKNQINLFKYNIKKLVRSKYNWELSSIKTCYAYKR